MLLNSKKIKKDFPIFGEHSNSIYLDNAATSQKPKSVINTLVDFFKSGFGEDIDG